MEGFGDYLKKRPIETPGDYAAAVEELALASAILNFRERYLELKDRDPKEVVLELVDQLHDQPQIISAEEAKKHIQELYISPGMRTSIDCGTPTELESYLLWRVLGQNKELLAFDSIESAESDNFSVAEGVHMLRDTVRTKRFIQGVSGAVQELVGLREDKEIHVCDAGSGALPVLGISAALASPWTKVVCLETNARAVAIATALVDSLGLSDRVEVVQTDARSYQSEHKIDLLVSETMDVGLTNEPMCEIIESLKGSIAEGGMVLPQKVDVFASTIPVEVYDKAEQYILIDEDVSPLIDVDWQQIGSYEPGRGVPTFSAQINSLGDRELVYVVLSSEVNVHKSVPPISFNESRLTSIMPISYTESRDLQPTRTGSQIRIMYQAGESPNNIKIDYLD